MNLLRRHPKTIEWISLASVMVFGDACIQKFENSLDGKKFSLDKQRSIAMAATGLMWVAPLTMAWFPFLHRFMNRYMSHLTEGTATYIGTKVMLENMCLALPVCTGFFIIPAIIEGGDQWNSLEERMNQIFFGTLCTDVAFWSCVAPFNYKFVPVRYQAALSCIFGGVEAAGLSYLAHIDDFKWPSFLNADEKK